MTAFVWIFMLSLMWAVMTGEFTLTNFGAGFVVGYVVLFSARHIVGVAPVLAKLPQFVSFCLFFGWELVVANLRVAHDVVTPRYRMRPGIIAVPLAARTDVEITSLANLISLTPGTLSLDVSSDRKVLYVYAMFVHDREQLVREIKDKLERRLLELLR